ncbi:PilZ domain-containing protein [Hydrogenovibrio marinus]|uniref:PilZ domain-containing protein n=1 Tax=Hydrogenovibrio marinus TaxID=28885 RepID=UPI0009DC95D3|nr:PilZ domain-containing protein [Hydrogenovibrio marinus]
MKSIIPNRRHYERVSTERPVTLLTPENNTLQGKMVDLSIHGAGIIVYSEYITCKEVQIMFNLPTNGGTPLTLSAVITHNSSIRGDCFLGLEFVGILKNYESAIHEFIRFHHRLD